MKTPRSYGNSSKCFPEQLLKQWLALATTHLSRGLTKRGRPVGGSADSARLMGFLELLYAMPATTTAQHQTILPLSCSSPFLEEIVHHQIRYIEEMLETRMGLVQGLTDSRVIILNIAPFSCDYSHALLEKVGSRLATDDSKDFLDVMKGVAARIWTLGTAGLAPADVSEADIEDIYREKREWMKKNQGKLAREVDDKGGAIKFPVRHIKKQQPVLVVLGFLPAFDQIDLELLANGQVLAQANAATDATNGEISHNQIKEHAAMEEYSLFLQRGPMPPENYWDAFGQYLKNRTTDVHSAPVTPGDYRALLDLRQQVRNYRLQCIRDYTGLHRAKAREDDALAGNQPSFFRLVEAMLQEAGQGVASVVAASEFLDNPDMAGMREHMLGAYKRITLDHILGIHRSTQRRQGESTARGVDMSPLSICGMLKTPGQMNGECKVLYRVHFGGGLMPLDHESRHETGADRVLAPNDLNKYSFLPPKVSLEYLSWFSLLDIAAESPICGLMEKRRGALVDIDRERLERRMRDYFDKKTSWDSLKALETGLTEVQSRFDPEATRKTALETSSFHESNVKLYSTKPFDTRWCYYSAVKSLWSDPKPQLAALQEGGNQFVIARAGKVVADEGVPFFFTPMLGDSDLLRGHTYYFPMWLQGNNGTRKANLSKPVLEYLSKLGILPAIPSIEAARLIWNHVLAIGFSPAYLNENIEGVSQGWPRIPLPSADDGDERMTARAKEALVESCRLGEIVTNLLNPAADVDGVTSGALRSDIASMAVIWDVVNDASFPTSEPTTIPVTMQWGKLSKERAVLPAHGRLRSRGFTPDEKLRLEDGAWIGGVRTGAAYACLGDETYDIYLDETVGVCNIPSKVWNFTLGGYQVLKKWLSYRETTILGRSLTHGEVELFCQIARRIAYLLLLGPRLNHNYAVCRDLHPLNGE